MASGVNYNCTLVRSVIDTNELENLIYRALEAFKGKINSEAYELLYLSYSHMQTQ
jgi:hypothetical protein